MKTQRLTLLLMICLITMSCSIDNSLFNARKFFRTAQARPLGANGRPTAQAIADYTKVIQKCGFILTERKQSWEADDALFLLARALYYKGNAAFQARDQFTSLISNFVDSPFVPEAYLYLARVTREVNRPEEAEKILEEFIRLPQFRKYHPRALLILVDFEIMDNDFIRAQHWLEKIITEYRGTEEYNEAFFLFGKNYFEQKNYERSLEEFNRFYDTRGVSKDLRLDALSYIALNKLELGQYDSGFRQVQTLISRELRTNQLANARVLRARYLLALGRNDEAKTEFEEVTRVYPRSSASADAIYYLAEFLYLQTGNRRDAITHYNRVRSEFATSPFAQIAIGKANALTQQIQGAGLNIENNMQGFIDYHFLTADNFLVFFNLPDSSIAYYDKIIRAGEQLIGKADSLSVQLLGMKAELDSLNLVLGVRDIPDIPEEIDEGRDYIADEKELIINGEKKPSLLDDDDQIVESKDSVELEEIKPPEDLDDPDSIDEHKKDESEPQPGDPSRLRQQELNSQIGTLQQRLDLLTPLVERLRAEHIPFAMFVKASVLHMYPQRRIALESLYEDMSLAYSNHKYTNAVRQLINNQPVRIIDPQEEEEERYLDLAFAYGKTEPDSMLAILKELVDSPYPDIRLRANFRLGWHYTFESPDTALAVQYLNETLRSDSAGEHADLVMRFYDGRYFTISFTDDDLGIDSLAVDTIPDTLGTVDEGEHYTDSDTLDVQYSNELDHPKDDWDGEIRQEGDIIRYPKLNPIKPEDNPPNQFQ